MKDVLWTAEAAAHAVGGRLIGADSWIASGVSIDTRTLEAGDLFVALSDARDGHDFVRDAFEAGASAALVSDAEKAGAFGPVLLAGDTLDGLRRLGAAARERSGARRIAVTGSVGKTSVKEALAHCLAPSGAVHASAKSYNNHWGVPLTLARLPERAAFGVFEIGMNHRGEILPLANQVKPHVAIVTWIAPAHVETLGSLDAIADEKGDVFIGLETGGVAIAPAEAPSAARLLAAAETNAATVIRFGRGAECEARLLSFAPDEAGAVAEADILGRGLRYRIGAPGEHWALNSVAVLAGVDAAGGDLQAAAHALASLAPPEGRGLARLVAGPRGDFTLIDDAYNANPASMAAALSTLATRKGERRLAVLGDMLELGPDTREYHAGLAEAVDKAGVDLVFAAGPLMASLYDRLPVSRQGGYAANAEALAPLVCAAVRGGDAVLVKGSNGSRMRAVVDALAAMGGMGS